MTHTLSEVGAAIGRLERLNGPAAQAREKHLRNLTQQLPFMTEGKRWKADTYSVAIVGALRVVQVAFDIGLGRRELHDLTSQFHRTDHLAPAVRVPGGFTKPTMAETALARAQAGEAFSICLDRTAGGQTLFRPGWTPHNAAAHATADAIFASAGAEPDLIATLEVKASRLISDLLTELGH